MNSETVKTKLEAVKRKVIYIIQLTYHLFVGLVLLCAACSIHVVCVCNIVLHYLTFYVCVLYVCVCVCVCVCVVCSEVM